MRLWSKPQRRTVKQSAAQTVPARGDLLGPSGLVSALGSIGSRSELAIQTKTKHTQVHWIAELYWHVALSCFVWWKDVILTLSTHHERVRLNKKGDKWSNKGDKQGAGKRRPSVTRRETKAERPPGRQAGRQVETSVKTSGQVYPEYAEETSAEEHWCGTEDAEKRYSREHRETLQPRPYAFKIPPSWTTTKLQNTTNI